jgi:tripartite-type tricarboxylate transporter receptor subunit TctC
LKLYIKANPDKVSYGSPGVGTISHLTMERLKAEFDFNVLHVPYKGSAAVFTDLVAGNVQFACEPPGVIAPLIKAGRIKAISVTSANRLPTFPNVPTIAETYPSFTSGAWVGLVVPKGVPNAIIQKINTDINSIVKEKSVKDKLEAAGLIVLSEGPSEFTKTALADNERYGKLVRQLNLKP